MTTLLFGNDADSFIWWDWVARNSDEIWDATVEHLQLTLLTVVIGVVLAVAPRRRRPAVPGGGHPDPLDRPALSTPIPSIALFGFLVPLARPRLPHRRWSALVGYTLVILVRNMVAGIEGVPPTVREAATAMGYTPWRRFVSVELPLALPTIMAGIRIATVGTVGLVTISALVGEGGYGALINNGLSRQNFSTPIVVGAALSIVMAARARPRSCGPPSGRSPRGSGRRGAVR